MRNAARKIPEIADADVVDEVVSLGIDRGDAGGAVEHVGPFGRLVPMQFAHAAGVQAHVHAGDVLGNPEFAHGDLAGPAAGLLPHMGVGEREAQIGQRAVIGRRRHQQIRILPVAGEVARTGIGAAMSGALRLRYGFAGLRAGRRLPP